MVSLGKPVAASGWIIAGGTLTVSLTHIFVLIGRWNGNLVSRFAGLAPRLELEPATD